MRGGRGIGLGRLGFAPHALHRAHPVAVAVRVLGPARGENAGPAVQRVDAQPAVVGQRRQSAKVRRLARLQVRIVAEAVADLLGLGEAELLGAEAGEAERLDQRRDLAQFSRIVGRDDQVVADRPHRPAAFNCAAKISEQPMRARRSSRSRPSSS